MSRGFSDMFSNRRALVRAPINPMDKATVVSIYNKRIDENKRTIQPGRFIIEPGSFEKPSVLTIGPSSWWREIDPEQPLLEIPVSSIKVAESIVVDFCNGLLCCDMGEKMPGLFYLPGEISPIEVKAKHRELLEATKVKQLNWYNDLIREADINWARSGGNPLSVSEDMMQAAHELGMKSKPWLANIVAPELSNCPACGTLRNTNFPICASCKTIVDPDKYNKLGLKQAV